MANELPRVIVLGDRTIEVEQRRIAARIAGYPMGGYATYGRHPRITLDDRLTPAEERGTLLHELIHQVLDRCGLKQDEYMTQHHSGWLRLALVQNPDMTDYLSEDV